MKRSNQVKFAARRAARASRAKNPGGSSRYARKARWCTKNGVWGWEVPEPKPWR